MLPERAEARDVWPLLSSCILGPEVDAGENLTDATLGEFLGGAVVSIGVYLGTW